MNTAQTIVFGGGCFWCTEAVFQMLKGIVSIEPGYAGGTTANPTYEDVCGGQSGHAEVIRVTFDPSLIRFEDLLAVFFGTHDPTSVNRQGHDVGTQYRSVILTTTPEQLEQAQLYVQNLNASTNEGQTIATEINPLENFYPAEDYHHSYYQKNSDAMYCQMVINPKLKKAKEQFTHLLNGS